MANNQLKVSKYPWVVCAVLFLFMFAGIGLANTAYGTHLPYLIEEYGMTNTESSLQASFRSFASLGTLLVLVPTFKKLRIKTVAIGAFIVGIIGWLVLAFAPTFKWLYVGNIFLGICFAASGMTTVTAFIRNWFVARRGLVAGIITAGTGLCATVLPPIQRAVIEGMGVRACFLVEAAMVAVTLVLVIIFLKDSPQEMGIYPLGGEKADAEEGEGEFVQNSKYSANTLCHVLICVFLICLGAFNYNAWGHLSVLYTNAGWSSADVATLLSFAGFVLIVTKIGYGLVVDKFPVNKTAWIFFGCCFAAMLMWWKLAGVMSMPLQFATFIVYGIGGVLCTTGISVFAMDMSTADNCKTIAALYLLVYNLGSMATAPIIGWIADLNNGNYAPSYLFMAGCAVVGYICTTTAYKIAERNAKAKAAENND